MVKLCDREFSPVSESKRLFHSYRQTETMKSNFPSNLNDFDFSMMPPSILGHLNFRFRDPDQPPLPPGTHSLNVLLELPGERDTLLIVPEGLDTTAPVKLLVMFHGAGGSAEKVMPFFKEHAEKNKFLLMIPQSTYITWDLTIGGNGPDLERLDRALDKVNSHFNLDRNHFGFCGFSDGASYSLSIGLSNGETVSHVIALSGGFMNLYVPRGRPLVFIAHSPEDEQLPMDISGLHHYKELKKAGYDIEFMEFHGRHLIHPHIVDKAMKFYLDRSPGRPQS